MAEPIAQALRQRKLKVFFDRWELAPGYPFLGKLEEVLRSCKAAVFLLGPHGWGPWQEQWEKGFALTRIHHEPAFPVIPVFLPGAGDLPLDFLLLQTGIDLREGVDDPIKLDAWRLRASDARCRSGAVSYPACVRTAASSHSAKRTRSSSVDERRSPITC